MSVSDRARDSLLHPAPAERSRSRHAESVDPVRPAALHSGSPVDDWLNFLAELLAKDFIRESEGGAA